MGLDIIWGILCGVAMVLAKYFRDIQKINENKVNWKSFDDYKNQHQTEHTIMQSDLKSLILRIEDKFDSRLARLENTTIQYGNIVNELKGSIETLRTLFSDFLANKK